MTDENELTTATAAWSHSTEPGAPGVLNWRVRTPDSEVGIEWTGLKMDFGPDEADRIDKLESDLLALSAQVACLEAHISTLEAQIFCGNTSR